MREEPYLSLNNFSNSPSALLEKSVTITVHEENARKYVLDVSCDSQVFQFDLLHNSFRIKAFYDALYEMTQKIYIQKAAM